MENSTSNLVLVEIFFGHGIKSSCKAEYYFFSVCVRVLVFWFSIFIQNFIPFYFIFFLVNSIYWFSLSLS